MLLIDSERCEPNSVSDTSKTKLDPSPAEKAVSFTSYISYSFYAIHNFGEMDTLYDGDEHFYSSLIFVVRSF
jgi:hypothetical protein